MSAHGDDRPEPSEEPEWMSTGRRMVADRSNRGAGAGVQFGAAVVVFTLAGLWLDRRLDTLPLFLLVGLALGFTGGLIHLMRTLGGRKSGSGHERAGGDDATRPPDGGA
ncbi:Putative F0F1-ATPase subunit (ATPase_gene1) [Planctomycetes bacterium Pla163]|uniref:F0F1-ATPase subunit (ATPase_gene1) n=1 Tax=Rohdeia mirabilis TaxID=2528008 RepID=A0A518D050_9BACT|nr:Putative F0F1-ATPase subunit (ATPase_gene1) [Planctomycetes bacterium Pla163]